jgi:diacylglycerol O-acyltransferase / wax synthase
MADRLSALDVSFLYLEEPTTPMHVGAVVFFEQGQVPLTHADLRHLISQRIAFVPRYRQRIKWVPGGIAAPVWVDDTSFDITYHVRASALPHPGSDEQLRDLVARIMARPLDRARPLWEVYLVEGLHDGRVALLYKTHHALIDGVGAMDIGQVILDRSPEPRETPSDAWRPRPEPSDAELVAEAFAELVARPAAAVEALRHSLNRPVVTGATRHAAATLNGLFSALQTVRKPPEARAINGPIGEARRFAKATSSLDDIKQVKNAHGGSVNDVVLATVAGALRSWLIQRGEQVEPGDHLRALVPVSVRGPQQGDPSHGGNAISSFLVDLPIGEADPLRRLADISTVMTGHKRSGQAVGAEALVRVASFTPGTVHSLGARVVNGLADRLFNVLISNVPGPQFPLWAGGARMVAAHPIVPLAKNQTLAIGVSSYNGGLYWGINADRDANPDVDQLAVAIENSLAELVALSPDHAAHHGGSTR